MLNPRELLPLAAVTAELAGEGGWLYSSPPSIDGPGGSLCALTATTYSYVVIPCSHQSNITILTFMSLCVVIKHDAKETNYKTFRIKIMWKKKSSPSGTIARNERAVQTICRIRRKQTQVGN